MMCSICKQAIPPPSPDSVSTGYATDGKGNKVCYVCCAEQDKAWMREKGKITLYVTYQKTVNGEQATVTNWPGSLSIRAPYVKTGRHNIARVRRDVWFRFEEALWHGVHYGDNTQLVHCKRTKEKTA